MAKHLCVTKHYGYHVQVHADYIDMFGGDHCAAVLLWIFEFSTNGETRRKERAQETGDPWLEASVSSLADETNGLYSKRSIEDRLAWLKQLGFISVKAGRRGTIHEYLLNGELVDSCLDSRKVFVRDSVRKIADEEIADDNISSAATSAATSAKTTENDGVLNLKVEELRTKNRIEDPPTPFEQKTEACSAQLARRILENISGLRKLSAKERSHFDENYQSSMGEDQVREAGQRLADWIKTAAIPIHSWSAVFLKDPDNWGLSPAVDRPVKNRRDGAADDAGAASPLPKESGAPESVSSAPASSTEVSVSWQSDPRYGQYLFELARTGKRVKATDAKSGFQVWSRLTEKEKDSSIEDIKYLVRNASEPKFVPNPAAHLAEEPWNNLRMPEVEKKIAFEKMDKMQQAWEIARQRGLTSR